MSEFRDFAMLRVGTSTADPEALARVVRKHKSGDVMTQAALTIALMLAICAVTFVLSVDRAAAAGFIGAASEGSLLPAAFAMALIVAAGLALHVVQTARMAARRVPVHARSRRPRA